MSIVNSIIHPKKFLGITDLKTGTLILSIVEFVFALLSFFGLNNKYASSLYALIAIICTGLCIYGVKKSKAIYISVYEKYLILSAIFAFILFLLSLITFYLSFIIVSFIEFIFSLYAYHVVGAYYHQVKDSQNAATADAGKV
ncbi:hypothetical protein LY90DRAFT_518384 [Neocallimastix californiae]|uniref:MARVEL domain-containing protein n=1 Tax=Neocallimastix californiae TaxID=1754190 RepID=A0A1Y1ZPI8_9FUNG|nr:hypothetical protein LY90DRAFT_518384 [Neocallimastix californiae]|eukprot:ORY12171.1 hypothetical protein LY90DRAFT_518384 [Neocallimastix californiae]